MIPSVMLMIFLCLEVPLLFQSVLSKPDATIAMQRMADVRTRRDTDDSDIEYLFYSRDGYRSVPLKPTAQSLDDARFNSDRRIEFIIHGWNYTFSPNNDYYLMKDEILKARHDNVIMIDWSKAITGTSASDANSQVLEIGRKIGAFVRFLIEDTGIDTEDIYFIGFGVGAHIAGCAARAIPNLIGRITALDAGGPEYLTLPRIARLNCYDAMIVDAIHTSGGSSDNSGYAILADTNFHPNGGVQQPGCNNDNVCNHRRSVSLYVASINNCTFWSFNCDSYDDLSSGTCNDRNNVADFMGFHAIPTPFLVKNTKFYLNTSDKYPYCTGKVY